MKYGKHTDLVETFLAHLNSGNVNWTPFRALGDDVAASLPKRTKRAPMFDAAWDDADIAAWVFAGDAGGNAAGWATYEILSHEVLAAQNKTLIFLPMFGINTIEQLKTIGNHNER
jgi:hypothetical protein